MDQLHQLRTLHLFAGAGGGLLADLLLAHRPVCAVEIDPYCQRVLAQRQADGLLPWFPIWDDVRTFDGHPWRGLVDVVAGGFPCQDISSAGTRQGLSGARSGLWTEFARLLGEIRPRYAFIENVPGLAIRGLDRVLSDLAALGMDARWCCLGADDVGAPHIRKRLWILADAHCAERWQNDLACRTARPQLLSQREEGATGSGPGRPDVADAHGLLHRHGHHGALTPERADPCPLKGHGDANADADHRQSPSWLGGAAHELAAWLDRAATGSGWGAGWEADTSRIASGIPHRVDRLKALGNGQVPLCAATAWRLLMSDAPAEEALEG